MKKNINFKKHFDILKKKELVFFDNSASTLKPKTVCDAVDYYNRYESVNSGRGVYRLAFEVTSKVEKVREKLSSFFGASEYDFVFTKNTSEAINLAALMFLQESLKKDDEILISEFEHNSNFLPWLALANKKQAIVKKVLTDKNGKITFQNFKKQITENTKFVSFAIANNTFGTIAEYEKIAEYCKQKNLPFLLDVSQAVAHQKFEFDLINPTFFVLSSYKMFGPTGVGVLAIKKNIAKKLQPLFYGGGGVLDVVDNQIELRESPQKFEVGTLDIAGIIGLGEAVDFIENIGFDFIKEREKELTDYFLSQVSQIEGFTLYNANPDLPIFLFNLKDIHSHDVATFYDEYNIMVRAGNHCNILTMQKLKEISAVRASLNFVNSKKEIDKFVFATKQILKYFA